jgi:hypothetical protein
MTDIIHQVVVKADSDKVREAVTTQAGLAAFWTDQTTAEPAAGSKAWFGFGPNAEMSFTFEVAAIEDERVAWTCVEGPDEWVGTHVNWILTPNNGGTTVRFEHRDWRSVEGALAECSFTWGQILARLAAYVDDGTVEPYFRQVA